MKEKRLFSIGEVARAIGITRKIILNYEEKGLIKPDQKEGNSGNRYYTIDTFTQIRTIRVFQEMGLSLDEVHTYFDGTSDLTPMIRRMEEMRDRLSMMIEKLRERSESEGEKVKRIVIEPQTIYRRHYAAAEVAEKTVLLRETALEAIRAYGTDTTRRMYFTEYSETNPAETDYCVAIPSESRGDGVEKIPRLEAIALFHHGSYETIPKSREILHRYALEQGIRLSGIFRNLYLEGPPQHKDPSKFVTQVIAFLEP